MQCQVASATDTGLEPGTFDVVVMRHVLAHNGGREQAIVNHLTSLVKPGGCVYLVDIEHTALRSRPADPVIEDLSSRYHRFQTARGNDLSVGLRLGELMDSAGLELVERHGWYDLFTPPPGFRSPPWAARDAMVATGFATQDDVASWTAAASSTDSACRTE